MFDTRGTTMGVPGPTTHVRCLLNQYWYSGALASDLCDVGRVVHPDREHLCGTRDGSEETDIVEGQARAVGDGVRGPLQGARAASEQLEHVAGQADAGAVRSTISSPTTTPERTPPSWWRWPSNSAAPSASVWSTVKLASRTT